VSTVCILHLDADAFFASLEQRDDPRLRGLPVAVGSGVIASCSYEARRYGVRTGMRLTDARRLCRDLRVIPGDYRRYEQAARRMQAICQEQTPLVEVAALDDLYLDLTHIPLPAEQIAHVLAVQVRDEIGLSVSIGIGTSKFVARVATRQAKAAGMRHEAKGMRQGPPPLGHGLPTVPLAPTEGLLLGTRGDLRSGEGRGQETPPQRGGHLMPHASCLMPPRIVRVPTGSERTYLSPWPVEMLLGVGSKMRARLERLNVRRIGEVADMPLSVLCGLFGRRGRVLRDLAWGIDPRPVQPQRVQQSVSRTTSFDPPTGDRAFVQAMLDHLLERAASWLRFQRLAARGLRLTLRYGDYRSEEGHASFATATDDEGLFLAAARERFARLYTRRLPLRLVGVELAPLQAPAGQTELFPDEALEQRRRLIACKDAIRQRFGFMALVNGSSLLLAEQLEHDRENFRLRTPCLTR
jgi:nucleotidyltransferase/DNA polymerase involved in DNA repair